MNNTRYYPPRICFVVKVGAFYILKNTLGHQIGSEHPTYSEALGYAQMFGYKPVTM